jgi:DNA-directed RNA polymerase delta subunit
MPNVLITAIKLSSGKTANFTRAQMIDVFFHTLNEDNLRALLGKRGWYLRGLEDKKFKEPMTVDDINKIVGSLTEKERQLGFMILEMNKSQLL